MELQKYCNIILRVMQVHSISIDVRHKTQLKAAGYLQKFMKLASKKFRLEEIVTSEDTMKSVVDLIKLTDDKGFDRCKSLIRDVSLHATESQASFFLFSCKFCIISPTSNPIFKV